MSRLSPLLKFTWLFMISCCSLGTAPMVFCGDKAKKLTLEKQCQWCFQFAWTIDGVAESFLIVEEQRKLTYPRSWDSCYAISYSPYLFPPRWCNFQFHITFSFYYNLPLENPDHFLVQLPQFHWIHSILLQTCIFRVELIFPDSDFLYYE